MSTTTRGRVWLLLRLLVAVGVAAAAAWLAHVLGPSGPMPPTSYLP